MKKPIVIIKNIPSWFMFLPKNKQRLVAVVTIFGVAMLGQFIVSSFAATRAYSPIPQVANMQHLTEQVISDTNNYNKLVTSNSNKKKNPPSDRKAKKQALIALVKQRKEAMKIAIQYDPQAAANDYLPQNTRDKLPTEAKEYLEQQTEIKGIWENGFIDFHKNISAESKKTMNNQYVMVYDNNRKLTRIYGNALPKLRSGSRVKVIGVKIEGVLALALPGTMNNSNSTPLSQILKHKAEALMPISSSGADSESSDIFNDVYNNLVFCEDNDSCTLFDTSIDLSGEDRKTLIIPIKFNNQQDEPFTIDEIAEISGNVHGSLKTMSYGKFKPGYEVLPEWVTLDINNTADCNPDNQGEYMSLIMENARLLFFENHSIRLIAKDGMFSDILFYLNAPPVCEDNDFAGQGYSSGGWTSGAKIYTMADSYVISYGDKNSTTTTMIHELGHAYGLSHAEGACVAPEDLKDPDIVEYCSASTNGSNYQNVYDNMGGGNYGSDSFDWSFANKARVGWVDFEGEEDSVLFSKEISGTFMLHALHKSEGVRAYRFPYGDDELLIEYRPKNGKGVDKFENGILRPGLINYINQNGSKEGITKLIGSSKKVTMKDAEVESVVWSYEEAGQLKPYHIEFNKNKFLCVNPSNATEDTIDITINFVHKETGCPKNPIAYYTDEKTIDYSAYKPDGAYKYYSSDIDVDKDGNIYLINSIDKEITKLDKDGKLLKTIKLNYDANVQDKIAVDSKGNIYFSIMQQLGLYEIEPWLIKYNQDGFEVARWGPGEWRHIQNGISSDTIMDIVIDSKDNIYFIYQRRTSAAWSNRTTSTVLKLNDNFLGNILTEIDRWELTDKHIALSMAIDKDDNIHVFELGRWNRSLTGWINLPENCVQVFNNEGNKLFDWCKRNPEFGTDPGDGSYSEDKILPRINYMELDKNGNYLMLPTKVSKEISMYNSAHGYIGGIRGASGDILSSIKLAPDGKLYAPIQQQSFIQVFTPQEQFMHYNHLEF